MQITNITIIKDGRSDCYSIMGITSIKDYIDYIDDIYKAGGGITGQRETLKTSSAIKIRKRMIADIAAGTVLPPVVLGILLTDEGFNHLSESISDKGSMAEHINSMINSHNESGNISLIDGMQRTTAIKEAVLCNDISTNNMRVEFWAVKSLNNLLYRMLILNTGQVPWNVRRQLEILFSSIKEEIEAAVPEATIYSINDAQRRSVSGQYQGDAIIELFLAFGARKVKIELKERIADEFTRLDFIETSEKNDLMNLFIRCFKMLCDFDIVLGSAKSTANAVPGHKFLSGSDLFGSQPARIGFIVALSLHIIGRPGIDVDAAKQICNLEKIETEFKSFIGRLKLLNSSSILKFLSYDTLNELLDVPSGKVGDYERSFFKEAFNTLIEEGFDLKNLDSCWRAY